MAQWNPPPPDASSPLTPSHPPHSHSPSHSEYDDTVGDTVFSRSWLLSLLVKAVQAVDMKRPLHGDLSASGESNKEEEKEEEEKEEEGKRGESCGGSGEVEVENEEEEEEEEEVGEEVGEEEREERALDEALENDLCQLWDVSMNAEVAQCLLELQAVELLLGVASRSSDPRLTEVSVGIVGNMACLEDVCLQSLNSPEQIDTVLRLLFSTDTRILCEATRLINTCLSQPRVQASWLEGARLSPHLLHCLLCILRDSASESLLRYAAELLDSLLLQDSAHLLRKWASPDLVSAMCEGAEQTRLCCLATTGRIVMTMQLLGTAEEGVASLMECETQLSELLCDFLLTLEPGQMDGNRRHTLAALDVLLTLAMNSRSGCTAGRMAAPNMHRLLLTLTSSSDDDIEPCLHHPHHSHLHTLSHTHTHTPTPLDTFPAHEHEPSSSCQPEIRPLVKSNSSVSHRQTDSDSDSDTINKATSSVERDTQPPQAMFTSNDIIVEIDDISNISKLAGKLLKYCS